MSHNEDHKDNGGGQEEWEKKEEVSGAVQLTGFPERGKKRNKKYRDDQWNNKIISQSWERIQVSVFRLKVLA